MRCNLCRLIWPHSSYHVFIILLKKPSLKRGLFCILYKKLFSCSINVVRHSHTLIKNILDDLNSFAPPKLAEKWDHVGLQVGRSNCKVTGVLVALDATQWTLHEAVQKKINLIITHHPLLPSKLTQNLKAMARKHQINILSFHT